jgi:CMP-N,N'-diacetyllegionaminic acid synthase
MQVDMINVLAIITARGGSKGIPGKNIKLLAGKPLITYVIEAANGSKLEHCIVSTDDQAIADVAVQVGGNVPFMRSVELAQDNSKSIDVAVDALTKYEETAGVKFDYVMILQPTTPFQVSEDINAALELADEKKPDSVVSLERLSDISLDKLKRLEDDEVLPAVTTEEEGTPRQQREQLYRRNGAIYMTRRDVLLAGSLFGSKTLGFVMPPERSVDINEPLDFEFAEFLANKAK